MSHERIGPQNLIAGGDITDDITDESAIMLTPEKEALRSKTLFSLTLSFL